MRLETLERFAEALKIKFALPGVASPEDQLKPVVAELLKAFGSERGLQIETRTETHLAELKVRPDMAVYSGDLVNGYIELKAPGLGADAPRLGGKHNKEQWEKLKALPNLIYTDGRDWALYRSGELADSQPIVRLRDDPTKAGRKAASQSDAEQLQRLFSDFLGWNPTVPHKPAELAKYLAPLTRFLRSEVENALSSEASAVSLLAKDWRQFFFPHADDARFADAYAQTVTYAMLLARLSGAQRLDPDHAAEALDKNNGLLAQTLKLMGHQAARRELSVGFAMLQRSLEQLDPHEFQKNSKTDLWLTFYEDFLAAYDPKLRKDYGVYYTPREVVELQVRLASELLDKRFGKKLGFADDGVVFLDPATGTGTYPVAAVKHALDLVRARSGPGAVPARARQMVENMHGFEVLVGPYAVAHLRLTQALESAMNEGRAEDEPEEGLGRRLNIYLSDTLESPNAAPPGGLTLNYRTLTQEHEAARKVKQSGEVLVCLGNPPYDRQNIEEGDETAEAKGGWVRFGDQVRGAARLDEQGEKAILRDFIDPAKKAGAGKYVVSLYNDYVYFWRWALWRLFEQQKTGGIVTFITPSSYLAGPGFVGVRELMRRTFDDLWIIDLGGDNLGTRKTPNVFAIQTPVAIAIGVRGAKPEPDKAANVRYTKIVASSREQKLDVLDSIADFNGLNWQDCPRDWHKPFISMSTGDYFIHPTLSDIFPFASPGAKFHRLWPIGATKEVLENRWKTIVSSSVTERQRLFRKSRDRDITSRVNIPDLAGYGEPALVDCRPDSGVPSAISYAYRAFDRHYALFDFRLGDMMRPSLWRIRGNRQIYFTTLSTQPLGVGPGILASASIPDMHHFCGRGGKDVIPLYRNPAGTEPNVTRGLLAALGVTYGFVPDAEDLAAYVYALLGGQSYTRRFWNELETPGPRVPITRDGALFAKAAALGRRLIWLHTYAERFRGEDLGDSIPPGRAKIIRGVPDDPAKYPEKYDYAGDRREIQVGEGRFGPVTPEIWNFEVSGLKVVQSWLGYRMKVRSGKKSSPLDDIRPERWTPKMSDEFLELLWVLEATLDMEPELEAILDNVVASPCFTAAELPQPRPEERLAPGTKSDAGGLLGLMGIEDDDSENEGDDED